MNNATLIAFTWFAVIAHMLVGVVALRRMSQLPLVPVLNLLVALCVLAYWLPRWYSYVSRDVTWYASDQLLPLYAIGVCILAGFTLTGRYPGGVPHGLIFGLHAVVLLGAALFFTFFRMDRLF